MGRSKVWADIEAERLRQDDKWGEQNHQDEMWALILGEEFGELQKAILETNFGGSDQGETHTELVHVAAVAVQWLEAMERRQQQSPNERYSYLTVKEATPEEQRNMLDMPRPVMERVKTEQEPLERRQMAHVVVFTTPDVMPAEFSVPHGQVRPLSGRGVDRFETLAIAPIPGECGYTTYVLYKEGVAITAQEQAHAEARKIMQRHGGRIRG